MVGTPGRSGGKNAKTSPVATSDGNPQSPRILSPRAQVLFVWLCERLDVGDPIKGWRRADGALLASLAEIMESQEHIASRIADDPASLGLHRLRNNLTQQVSRLSATIGLCPFDRSRQPAVDVEQTQDDPILASIFNRMANG